MQPTKRTRSSADRLHASWPLALGVTTLLLGCGNAGSGHAQPTPTATSVDANGSPAAAPGSNAAASSSGSSSSATTNGASSSMGSSGAANPSGPSGGDAASGSSDATTGGGPNGNGAETDGGSSDAAYDGSSAPGPAVDGAAVATGWGTIHNDFFWYDQDGNLINTRSGKIRQFGTLYYWYGGAPGAADQNLYTSPDFVHWTYKGVVFHSPVEANRLDVLYNAATQTYVMFLKYDGDSAYLGIATSPTPDGTFTFQSQTLVDGYTIGDMSMFEDDDGQAYLAYVWWETGPNREHGIYRMSADYLTLAERVYLWNIPSREAPHIFKRNGVYYYGTSRTAGINPTATEYYTATNLAGPWSAATNLTTPGSATSYQTQCDFVFPVAGTQGTYFMYDGDRWLPTGASEGDYVWLPLAFDDAGLPSMNYYQDWDFNLGTGTWRTFDLTRDLALGKTATASSDDGTNLPASVTTATTYLTYAATRWESEAADPQWVMVDLGAPTQVDRVILKWYLDYAKAFEIQVSVDGTTWTPVYTTTIGASYSVTDVTFAETSARYVRMLGTQRGTANGYSLFAFMVLDDP
ncbi:MAG: discoidin domain-containing protein [Polyangiaceae bacterium]